MTQNTDLLQEALAGWHSLASFRKGRKRNIDYTFGRQWNDIVVKEGREMSEFDHLMREGYQPLKNNLIRRVVRNVNGVFRRKLSEKMRQWNPLLLSIAEENSLYELYSRQMEEFLISGMVVVRKSFERRNGMPGVVTTVVSPSSFFCNPSASDIRGWDLDLVGCFHDVSFRQWCSEFVKTRADYRRACETFLAGRPKVRVMEVWKREMRPRILVQDPLSGSLLKFDAGRSLNIPSRGRSKWFLDDVWRYYFLDSEGKVLAEGDSPYVHGSHPFVLKRYPLMEGEVHSLVSDIIDQQRFTNRLITLYDSAIRSSAKGVLLIPEGSFKDDCYQEAVDVWGRHDGVIIYQSKPDIPEPKQVTGDLSNLGINQLLEIQLKMLEDVSGVNGVLQGSLSHNSTSGTLFTQQTENAMTSLSDIIDTFFAFIDDCNRVDLSLAAQIRGQSETDVKMDPYWHNETQNGASDDK